MGILYSIIVGIVAGWLGGKLTKGSGFGLIGNMIIGIIGAVVGGLLAVPLGIGADNIVGSILIATGGAVVFLWVLSFFRK
ncbi:MAG: GlsB/YeaQ/YmgE family stress response membrane protein [Planctomycetaceae bacterium]|nr:GlsB/YeaQ/YmgE family stress response membrane protein [Planctomycetaceae bacterium]